MPWSAAQIEASRLQAIVAIRRLIGAWQTHTSRLDAEIHALPGWRVFNPALEAQTGGKGHASRYEARAAGLCGCGAPLEEGFRQCHGCRVTQTARQRRRVELDIANGTCIISGCVSAAAPGRRSCERHLREARERERARRERRRQADIAATMAGDRDRAGRYARPARRRRV